MLSCYVFSPSCLYSVRLRDRELPLKGLFWWSAAPLVFQTVMWLWQGAWRASRVCVTTSQLLLRDITADNLPWIFISHCCWRTHVHAHTHTQMVIIYDNAPLIKESSLSPRRAAQFGWNNQSVEAFRVRLSFCLSQHTSPLLGNTLTEARLIPFLSPNVDSRVCSGRALWLH